MISTTYLGTTTSTSRKTLKTTYDNSKSKIPFENTYTFSETTSRTMSASASVGASILSAEVKASIGGEASYSRTQSYSAQVRVPAGKIGRVYVSEKTEVARFRHVIQPQKQRPGDNDFKNELGMQTQYSTVTTKSPVFSLETN